MDLERHQNQQTTIAVSRENHQTLLQFGAKGQSFDQILTEILADKKSIAKILLERQQKKLSELGSTGDDQSTEDTTQATTTGTDQMAENPGRRF